MVGDIWPSFTVCFLQVLSAWMFNMELRKYHLGHKIAVICVNIHKKFLDIVINVSLLYSNNAYHFSWYAIKINGTNTCCMQNELADAFWCRFISMTSDLISETWARANACSPLEQCEPCPPAAGAGVWCEYCMDDRQQSWQNGCHFGRRQFQMQFLEWKWQNSESDFTEICRQESNWQLASLGSGNGLAPNRRQAITWTNAGPVQWRIYAALGGDDLTHWGWDKMAAILHMTFSSAFPWMKLFEFWIKSHWNMFLCV